MQHFFFKSKPWKVRSGNPVMFRG